MSENSKAIIQEINSHSFSSAESLSLKQVVAMAETMVEDMKAIRNSEEFLEAEHFDEDENWIIELAETDPDLAKAVKSNIEMRANIIAREQTKYDNAISSLTRFIEDPASLMGGGEAFLQSNQTQVLTITSDPEFESMTLAELRKDLNISSVGKIITTFETLLNMMNAEGSLKNLETLVTDLGEWIVEQRAKVIDTDSLEQVRDEDGVEA